MLESERLNAVPFETSHALKNAGMKRCDECGEINPIERNACIECGAIIVMFVTP